MAKRQPAGRRKIMVPTRSKGTLDERPPGSPMDQLDQHLRRLDELHAAIESAIGALAREAYTDHLTGLPNRGAFERALGREFEAARKLGVPLAAVMVDVDRFKVINDTYGHEVGDAVLREVAQLLHANASAADVVARLGGEEFAVLMTGLEREQARRAAERLREAISRHAFLCGDVTASFGVAVCPNDASLPHDLIRVADAALYRAKRAGRDRVVVAAADGDCPHSAN